MAGLEDYYRAEKKQRFINFFERFKGIRFEYLEYNGFHTSVILSAEDCFIRELIISLPQDFYCQVNKRTGRFEVFTDSETHKIKP